MKAKIWVAAAAVTALSLAVLGTSIGQTDDCLSTDYLAKGEIVRTGGGPPSDAVAERAKAVAEKEMPSGAVGRVDEADLTIGTGSGASHLRSATLVEVVLDGQPEQLFGAVGAPAVTVTTPCAVVVVDEHGNYVVTYRYSEPVD